MTHQRSGSTVIGIVTLIGVLLGGCGTAVVAYFAYQTYDKQKKTSAVSSGSFDTPSTLGGGSRNCATDVPQSGTQIGGAAHPIGDQQIWLLIQAPGNGKFYLPQGHQLAIGKGGRWSAAVPAFGSSTDSGQKFTLVLASVDINGASSLERAFDEYKGSDAPSVDSLPLNSTSIAQACVVRE